MKPKSTGRPASSVSRRFAAKNWSLVSVKMWVCTRSGDAMSGSGSTAMAIDGGCTSDSDSEFAMLISTTTAGLSRA